MAEYKRPESVLVVIHTTDLQVLLLQRRHPADAWQSVTGSLERDERPIEAAIREVFEETGLQVEEDALRDWHLQRRFEILDAWRSRFAPGVSHNIEHRFSLCLPDPQPVQLAPAEHCAQQWLSAFEAAKLTFSWTNREAIEALIAEAADPAGNR